MCAGPAILHINQHLKRLSISGTHVDFSCTFGFSCAENLLCKLHACEAVYL